MSKSGKLSKRELQVVELLSWGAPKSEVADMLFISYDTVVNHVRNIFVKLGVHSATELSAWYFCTHYHIPLDLSPLKRRITAICLLSLIIATELHSSSNVFRPTRVRTTRMAISSSRRSKRELDLSEFFI